MLVSNDTTGPSALVRAESASDPPNRLEVDALGEVTRSFREVLTSVERTEGRVDRAVRRISRGADLSSAELLALQTSVYRASQKAELVSRAVDRISDTIREITQIRV